MKPFILLTFLSCTLLLPLAQGEDKAKVDAGQAVAAAYFEALFTGDAKKATELSTVPFSLDRKKVLKTEKEVAAIHEEIVGDKGKRQLPKYTLAPTDKAAKLDAEIFPKHTAYRVLIDDEHVDVYVTQGDGPKVIGFSD
ncbi:MAG: hypothetical protein WD768_09640 [Phycisphaeraceae bacterium]